MRTSQEIWDSSRDVSPFSNSDQYESWVNGPRGCYWCKNDSMDRLSEPERFCPILTIAESGHTPAEWVSLADDHDYTCTEFDDRDNGGDDDPEPEPGPPPVIDGQIDMFEVFAERITDEAARVEVARR